MAKCWALETAVLVGQDKQLADELPDNAYHDYFTPDFRLNASRKRIMEDENSKSEVERIKIEVLENLRHLKFAPGQLLGTYSGCRSSAILRHLHSEFHQEVWDLLKHLQLAFLGLC